MKLWKWLNGKKTVFAEFYWTVSAGVIMIWFPSGIPEPWNKVQLTAGLVFTALGLGHKGIKKYVAGTEGEK